MQCGCEAWWDSSLISCFGDVALWVTPVGLWVISLHEFSEAGVKLVVGFWVWCWWWSQSYLFGEMRMGEVTAPNGR